MRRKRGLLSAVGRARRFLRFASKPRTSEAPVVARFLSKCGGLDAALCSPALPAALWRASIVEGAAGKAGEHKAVSGPPHFERDLATTGASGLGVSMPLAAQLAKKRESLNRG